MHNPIRSAALAAAMTAVAAALAATQPASAQDACANAGVDPACCAVVCAVNPPCCGAAWDAACDALLASANCQCQGAVPVTLGTVAVDTRGSTRDLNLSGHCDPGPFGDDILHNCVVLAWTPPAPGRYTLSTCNQAPFDTRLAVLSGCNAGSVVGCNDDGDGCDAFTSVLSVELAAATEHYIVLGGYAESDVGACMLTIQPYQAQLALEGAHRFESAAGGTGHWYAKFRVAPGATWSDLQAKAVAMGGTLACANTAGENRMLGSLYQSTGLGSTVAIGLVQDAATPRSAEPAGGWRWVDGGGLSYASWSGSEPNNAGGAEHVGQFVSFGSGDFWQDQRDDAAWSHAILEFGPKALPFVPPAPSNDERAGAIAIEIGQLNVVSLVGATTSADAAPCADPLFYDRWYSVTPASTDSYDFAVCGNGFTAAVAVYAPSGGLVACSLGACTLSASLSAGQTYLVRVGSPDGDRTGIPTLLVYPTPRIASLDALSVNFVGGLAVDGSDGGRCVETETFPAGADDWGTLRWVNLVGANSAAAAANAENGNGDLPTSLPDGRGAPTGAAVSFAAGGTRRIFSFPADDTERMRRGYLDTNGLTALTVTVSGVPYERYAVVAYFGADGPDRPGSIAVNGATPVHFKTDAVPAGAFNPLVRATAAGASTAIRSSYAVFEGLTGPSCSIVLTESGPNIGLMGFQLIRQDAPCPADLDGDGLVSAPDLASLLSGWGTPAGDVDGDGATNAQDIAALLSAWGACP